MCPMNLHVWATLCCFPNVIWLQGTMCWNKYSVAPLLRIVELAGFHQIFRRLHADKCILLPLDAGLSVKDRSLPSCPPGSCPSAAIIATRGASPDRPWHWGMGAIPCSCHHHPPFVCCPLPGIWDICLAKLINLFNDAISFFHINLCPETWPLSVLPRRGALTRGWLSELELVPLCLEGGWLSVSGVGTCLGEHQGTIVWISWIFRMTVLIHKCDIWCPADGWHYSKSIWWKEDLAFFILWGAEWGTSLSSPIRLLRHLR